MAKIFITGSSDGLGLLAAESLIRQGHEVVLHARNKDRYDDTIRKTGNKQKVLIADLSKIEETKKLASEVNSLGRFDAVIHNAGVYQTNNKTIFAVNSLAPYILTCLIQKPSRLIYLSSAMHLYGSPSLENISSPTPSANYSDSKLHVVLLSMAVARMWKDVYSNAVNPGWVPTKMGGKGAPDDLKKGFETQVWLATSVEKEARINGKYFFHKKENKYSNYADDVTMQEKLLELCEKISGVKFPG